MATNPSVSDPPVPRFIERDDLGMVDITTVNNKAARALEILSQPKLPAALKQELAALVNYLSNASAEAVNDAKSDRLRAAQSAAPGPGRKSWSSALAGRPVSLPPRTPNPIQNPTSKQQSPRANCYVLPNENQQPTECIAQI